MDELRDAFETVERRRKRLVVYGDGPAVADGLRRQFSTRNADVEFRRTGAFAHSGFVVVRGQDGEFMGALGLDHLDAILAPKIHPPWRIDDSEPDVAAVFDFLENTLFTSYDRSQMLAVSREIEERAWRTADGRLHTGFQREKAAVEQADVYAELASRGSLSVTAFLDDDWTDATPDVSVVTDSNGEIGRFWFVCFDGAGSDMRKCAVLAEERDPGRFYGFWTYDPDLVDDLFAYLDSRYDPD
ncbi:DICT sensory domain-containing protein [Natrialbaceae archaeon GCM10025810]|uniref:DICT sensory domain-containing protein n=1 Tax=Halovalidus salilacus TaxID=3075124 RepID=UPI00360B00DD